MLNTAESRTKAVRVLFGSAVVFLFALGAIVWLWTSVVAVANFALRYPAWDQYRSYVLYLTNSFPINAIQPENGHSTILPNLIRLAEIQWFSASQSVQIGVGCAAALIALTLIVVTILREKNISPVAQAATSLLAVIAFFWLGNARMLFHGNELLHVYFVVLFCVIAILAVCNSRKNRPTFWMLVASIFCAAATFSFGTGMASFAAVLSIGLILRLRWRYLAIPGTVLMATLYIYLVVLPGNSGVRQVVFFDPIANSAIFLRWLSAPWVTAWLGNSIPISSWTQKLPIISGIGEVVSDIFSWTTSSFGGDVQMRYGLLVGILGIIGYITIFTHACRHHLFLSRTQVLALGLSTFVLGAAAIICLARIGLFAASPGQIFADRYLPWSCLFWLGLGMHAAATNSNCHRWHTPAIAILTGIVWTIFSPSNSSGWMAVVHKNNQQSAVAAQLGIWDPDRFPDDDSASRENTLTTLALLKKKNLSMFAEPAFHIAEEGWHAPAQIPTDLLGSSAHVVRQFEDVPKKRIIADIEGYLPLPHGLKQDIVLVVVNGYGDFRGLAKFGFTGAHEKWGNYRLARMRGFDGYALDPQSGERLHVLALDAMSKQVIAVTSLEIPAIEVSQPPLIGKLNTKP